MSRKLPPPPPLTCLTSFVNIPFIHALCDARFLKSFVAYLSFKKNKKAGLAHTFVPSCNYDRHVRLERYTFKLTGYNVKAKIFMHDQMVNFYTNISDESNKRSKTVNYNFLVSETLAKSVYSLGSTTCRL